MRLEYRIPARGLIGFQGEFLDLTARHRPRQPRVRRLRRYWPARWPSRRNGVLISQNDGEAVAYARGTCGTAAACS